MKQLGFIAGGGDFPLVFANSAKSKGISLICVALKNEASPKLEGLVDKIYWVTLGEAKKVIDIFKKEHIKQAVMLGSVAKPRFLKDRPKTDETSNLILKIAKDKRDLTLFRAAAMILRLSGIKLLSALICLEDHLAREGYLTKIKPNRKEWEDIRFGFRIAKRLASLDIGQTVVIKDKIVLSVEAIEGTDAAIKRAGTLGSGDIVVVKVARPNQDMRFDIPVIGLHTINSLKEAHASVLALEKNKTLIINKEELVKLADEAGIAVVVV